MVRKSTVKPANKELQNNNAKHQINTNHSISYLRIQPNNCVCQLPKLRSPSDKRVLTVHKSKCEIDLDNIYANGNYGSVSSRQIPPPRGGGGIAISNTEVALWDQQIHTKKKKKKKIGTNSPPCGQGRNVFFPKFNNDKCTGALKTFDKKCPTLENHD